MKLTPDILSELYRLLCPFCAGHQHPRFREDTREWVHDSKVHQSHGYLASHNFCRASGLRIFVENCVHEPELESVEELYPLVCRGCREKEPVRPRPDACPDWLHEVEYGRQIHQSRCMASGLRNSRFAGVPEVKPIEAMK
jgi:hypothetical protein